MSERKRTPRTANRFNQREIARAMRAVRDAGADIERVEVDATRGKFSVILAKPGTAQAENGGAQVWNDATEAIMKSKGAPTRR